MHGRIATARTKNASVWGGGWELLLLYNTLILPHLCYCAVVWGGSYTALKGPPRLSKIVKLQKRALRVIDSKPYLYLSNDLFVKYRVLKLPELRADHWTKYNGIVGVFKWHVTPVPVSTVSYQRTIITRAPEHRQMFNLALNHWGKGNQAT